ncbi:MAG TPA: type II toxin-antitoxin system PemK/MazF family toxin [Bacilli bacterium]|nr:type II toxin-antitoxin system PemK/MazF family toxin [Bacilli bacterium]HPS18713.1 type II toxin-antitoxin system PemK/MazF family toxin [Bacilli bacterium]
MSGPNYYGSGKYRWIDNTDYDDRSLPSKMIGRKEQLDWIKRQLEYSMFAEKYKLRYDLKKGDILEFDWGINVNAEFSNRHFGVVLADSGEYNPLVIVCPLKSNKNGGHPRSDVDLGIIQCLKTGHSTLAVINQIRAIDKLRIYTKLAIGNDGEFNEYDTHANEVYRLEERKVELITQAYINLLTLQYDYKSGV